MDNPTNKLAAFCTTGCFSQEVGQIIICLDVSISDSPVATDSRIAWKQIELHLFVKVDSGREEMVT
jgi:hypothetical protein